MKTGSGKTPPEPMPAMTMPGNPIMAPQDVAAAEREAYAAALEDIFRGGAQLLSGVNVKDREQSEEQQKMAKDLLRHRAALAQAERESKDWAPTVEIG